MGSYTAMGGGIAVLGMVLVGGMNAYDRSANYTPGTAEVYHIERTCNFNTKTRAQIHGAMREVQGESRDDCDSTDEFARLRTQSPRSMDVDGHATYKVTYASPTDRSTLTGTLDYDGHDDQFYSVKAHDTIKILIDKADPTKIRKF